MMGDPLKRVSRKTSYLQVRLAFPINSDSFEPV
jgi:hypothetical protein